MSMIPGPDMSDRRPELDDGEELLSDFAANRTQGASWRSLQPGAIRC